MARPSRHQLRSVALTRLQPRRLAALLAALTLVIGSAPAPATATDPTPSADEFTPPEVVDRPRLDRPSSESSAGITAAAEFSIPGFQETIVFSGLSQPIVVEFSPDGRVFVAEKSGVIKVFDSLTDPAPSIWANVSTNVHDYWDRGLLGMTLDPNFPTTERVYVSYAYNSASPPWPDGNCPSPPGGTTDGCVIGGRLSALEQGEPEEVLVEDWCQQFPSHSMSDIVFDDAGALYVNGGDGANFNATDTGQWGGSLPETPTPVNPCGDPPNEGGALRSQDLRGTGDPVGLSGTVVRVNRFTGEPMPDNPASGAADDNEKRIVAYGLRNPFRMAMHPVTGELWIGDVGWSAWEEIDRHTDPDGAVRNFGWPCREGASFEPGGYGSVDLCESMTTWTGPHFAYSHGSEVVSGDGCGGGGSLSGMAFYEGGDYPDTYDNALFFTDYSRKCLWVIPDTNQDGIPDVGSRAHFADLADPVQLTTGPSGDLFYVDIGDFAVPNSGSVRRISFDVNDPPVADANADPTSGAAPLEVEFDASGSTDPEGDPLTYAWDFDDDGDGLFNDAAGISPSHVYASPGSYDARVRVRDDNGGEDIDEVTVNVDNEGPVADITQPASSLQWSVNQMISFSGTGIDPDEGSLDADAFTWQLIQHHCPLGVCHAHPVGTFPDTKNGSFPAPDHEYPSHLELTLTVEDQFGVTDTDSVTIQPRTVNLRIESEPAGMTLTAGWVTDQAPFTLTAIAGSTIQLRAPDPQSNGGVEYTWQSWSDGGAATHLVTAATSGTYLATFAGDDVGGSVSFTDIAGSPFRGDIAWLVEHGITAGCAPTRYCPDATVTREQMASFLVRALGLTAGATPDRFTDIAGSGHRGDINRLATAGITAGCTATRFCPSARVTREQMASFLARALELGGSAPDAFGDDDDSQHEGAINRLAQAGVTAGCGPNRFCPTASVTRGQMAAFLHRAFEGLFP
ncbi:MAG: PQQ-dependent sugar dehydrogenase [Candidatus Limnocylindria bacterium]